MPQLAFLHGNVAIGFCDDDRVCGWHDDSCNKCGRPFAPSPLLFPVENKDYTSEPSIRSQWSLLERELANAYFVTILGYSAPTTDAAAREIPLDVWSENKTREIAQVELIDIRPEDQLIASWDRFIVRNNYGTGTTVQRAYSSRHPRRSCDALFAATMMQNPWKADWLPDLTDPDELRGWVETLWKEETRLRGTDAQFSGRPCAEWHASKADSD